MSETKIALDEWLHTMADAAREIASTSLGFERCEITGQRDNPPEGQSGAYIPVISQEHTLQLALISNKAGCQQIAQALLGMDPAEDALPAEDIADAVGEVINMVAGGVKRRLITKDPQLQLGLPIFVHGYVEATEVLERAVSDVCLGPVPAHFLVLRHRKKNA